MAMQFLLFFRHGIKFMELFAAVVGLLHWGKLKNSYFKWFIIYLFVITICEFIGYYLNLKEIKGGKEMYHFFVIPLEFLFFHWLYFNNFKTSLKKMAIGCSVLYILFWLIEFIFFQKSKMAFYSLSYSVGSITILILSIIYFLELMKSERIIKFKTEFFFWINLGLLLFYLGTFPYYGLFNFLVKQHYGLFIILTWFEVGLNYLMYALFIIGFIWGKPK